MTPWLSILIPVYNVERFLQECLDSVFEQNCAGLEIIALDDQSTDGSYALLQKLQSTSNLNFKVLQHPENKGVSVARNTLLKAATGEYVWFLDSDDALAQGAIAQLNNIVNLYAPDLVMCDYQIWRMSKNPSRRKAKKEQAIPTFSGPAEVLLSNADALFSGLYRCGKLHCWSKISKRHLWDDSLLFPEGQYFEDMVVTPRLAARAKTYYYMPQVWVLYRQWSGSIMATPSLKKIDNMASGVNDILVDWQARQPALGLLARWVFIDYCVKVFFFTVKELKKIGQCTPEQVAHYEAMFFKNIGYSKSQLIINYLLRGRFFKLLKFFRYANSATKN